MLELTIINGILRLYVLDGRVNIFKKASSRFNLRKKPIFRLTIIAVLISISTLVVLTYFNLNNATPSRIISLDNAKPLNKGDMQIDSGISFLGDDAKNNNQSFNGGDSVRFTFDIQNTTQNGSKSISINSGIPVGTVFFICNLEGVTGYDISDGKIIFTNMIIYPLQKQTISFDANFLYSASDTSLEYTPSVVNEKDDVIAEGKSHAYKIARTDSKDMPVTVSTKQEEGQ